MRTRTLGNRLLEYAGLDGSERRSRGACNLLDNVGLIIVAPVDQRAKSGDHLDHRNVKILSEGVGRQHGVGHRCVRDELVRSCLIRQINAGLQAKVVDVLELGKVLFADLLDHFHQRHVAGILDRFSCRQPSVAVSRVALDLKAVDHLIAVAVILIAVAHGACIEAHRNGKGLGCRAGLIVIADTEVSPQRIEVTRLVLLGHRQKIRVGEVAVLGLVVFIELGHAPQRRQIGRVIEVKKWRSRHRQHFSVITIHDNAGRVVGAESFPVLILEGVIEPRQTLLDNTLYIGVQRKDQVVAVLGLDHCLLHVEAFVEVAVLSSDDAVERIIVVLFKAARSDVARTREAQHVAGQIPMGIETLVAAFKPDALDIIIFSLRRRDLLFFLLCYSRCHLFQIGLAVLIREILQRNIILGGRMVGDIFLDAVSVDAKALQRIERRLQIYVLLQDLFGIHDDVVNQLAVRQDCAFTI